MRQYLILSSLVLILNACGESSSTNSAPIANAGADQEVMVNHYLTIVGTGTDSDGTIVSYEWKKGEIVLATTATFNYLATAETSETVVSPSTSSDIGTDILTLTVVDNDGAIGIDEVRVRVIEEVVSSESSSCSENGVTVSPCPTESSSTNSAPIANAGADQEVMVNHYLTIVGTGTDSDGTIVSYEWKKGEIVLATTATFNYLATAETSETVVSPSTSSDIGTDILTLTVVDNDGAIGIDEVRVRVIEEVVSSESSSCSENGVTVSPCPT